MEITSSSPIKCQDWAVCPETTQLQLRLALEAGETPLHCVGSLQVQHKLQLGFICGSLPVPTHIDVMTCKSTSVTEAAIVPAISIENERVMAPRYRMLPNQTDLNSFFVSEVLEHDHLLPATSGRAPEGVQELCTTWGKSYHTQPLARKCETLAVSGLAGCGDQIDIIAPVDILKKIFKIPYSKAGVSIAVHRVGQTLILNTGPDVNEGENLARAKRSQAKAKERSLFLKFAMQSAVRAEACDCPVSQNVEEQSSASKSSSSDSLRDLDDDLPDKNEQVHEWKYMVDDIVEKQKRGSRSTKSMDKGHGENDYEKRVSWSGSKDTDSVFGSDSHKKSSIIGEHQKDPDWIPNSSNHKRSSSTEGFLRVLFWQLEEIRMLLGSDLLLFSNEKHVAVSLHLWETERQVTPLMWLDAWLDNVMASVPELAICYHHNGIVQGYELLKTHDIFLLKGLSKDGTSFFHPHVVQQNALSVLRFLQENCKQDLGTYWLFKNSGEDLVQLFDLSVISNKHTTRTKHEEKVPSLPSSWNRGKGSPSLPLGILLYRLAHRLSLSQDPSDRCKCASFFKKCIELLGEQDHLFVRASAHEHVARLILKCYEELGSTLMPFLLEARKDDNEPQGSVSDPLAQTFDAEMCQSKPFKSSFAVDSTLERSDADTSVMVAKLDACSCEKKQDDVPGKEVFKSGVTHIEGSCGLRSQISLASSGPEADSDQPEPAKVDLNSVLDSANTVVAPITARLTAVHHVSQAIKALRWQRQLQDVEERVLTSESKLFGLHNFVHLVPVCVCGELDCIEYCDIRDCEIGPFMDQKLVQLVLLLGESYLALGQAYKDDRQLKQALKAAELACSVYQSMPMQYRHGNKDASKNSKAPWAPIPALQSSVLEVPKPPALRSQSVLRTFCQPIFTDPDAGMCANKCLFWGQAWILVGDIYVEYQRLEKDEKETSRNNEVSMAQEVAKEVKRLRKKLSQGRKSCSVCSTVNCSCESDRASSGNSASSSSSSGSLLNQAHRHSKKANTHATDRRYGDLDQLGTQRSSFPKIRGKQVAGEPSKQGLACDIDEEHGMKPRKQDDTKSCVSLESTESKCAFDKAEPSIAAPEDKDSGLKPRKQDDIFSYLQGAKHIGREDNLLVAVECYDAALLVLGEMSHGSEEIKSALRKKGWAYNEIGRMKLACGNMKTAETVFEKAINAFKDVKDQTNVVLIYYNMAHGQRGVAEALVSQLDSWKSAGLFEYFWKKLFDDAATAYLEALRVYGLARKESRLLSDDLDSEKVNLCNEVLTQYAHTHLRLGMLLAREEKHGPSVLKHRAEASNNEGGSNQNLHSEKIRMTANEAIREAIALYGSLGSLREQELAFAQFQLACQHRDCCLAMIELEGEKPNDAALLLQSKRYLSLADRYWVKALKYYRCTTHPDMFLEIQMQRSDLNLAIASASNLVSLFEVALSHLLEGRNTHVPATTNSSTHVRDGLKPSGSVYDKFTKKLQHLLRTMLAAMQNLQKSGPHRNITGGQTKSNQSVDSKREGHRLGQIGDAAKLKEMYRMALQSSGGPLDVNRMYNLWVS